MATSFLRATSRNAHSSSSPTPRMRSVNPRGSPSQRSLPQTLVQSASDSGESQEGTWTPLVTCPTGTSLWGQRGKSGWKRRRLTSPCSRLTPLTAPLALMARKAMLKRLPVLARAQGEKPLHVDAEFLDVLGRDTP